MIINGEWKNKVRTMRTNGDNEGAKKELRKAKMSNAYQRTNDKNKIFIDYCLAHHSYIENNFELTNIYLNNIENIFNNDNQKIKDMNLEYCNFLWLYVNVNYNVIPIEKIVESMNYVYEYYLSIDENDIAISALVNIFRFQGNEDKILKGLESLLQCKNISDWNFVESILIDCENINHSLYIKAKNIVNNYNINIDIV